MTVDDVVCEWHISRCNRPVCIDGKSFNARWPIRKNNMRDKCFEIMIKQG